MVFKIIVLMLFLLSSINIRAELLQPEYAVIYSEALGLERKSDCKSKSKALSLFGKLEEVDKPYHFLHMADLLLTERCSFANVELALNILEKAQKAKLHTSFQKAAWLFLNKKFEHSSIEKAYLLFEEEFRLSKTAESAFGLALSSYLKGANSYNDAMSWANVALDLGDERAGVLYIILSHQL